MRKLILALVSVLILVIIMAFPAFAFDPSDPTDNATAQYVFTDNFSISTDNFTITFGGPLTFSMDLTAFTDAINAGMLAASEEHADILGDAILDSLIVSILFAYALLMIILAYWRKERLLYILAGFALMINGFEWWEWSWGMSIILVLFGFYTFAKIADRGRNNA